MYENNLPANLADLPQESSKIWLWLSLGIAGYYLFKDNKPKRKQSEPSQTPSDLHGLSGNLRTCDAWFQTVDNRGKSVNRCFIYKPSCNTKKCKADTALSGLGMNLVHYSKSENFKPKRMKTTIMGDGLYFYEAPKYIEDVKEMSEAWGERLPFFYEIDDRYIDKDESTGGPTEYFVEAKNFKHLKQIEPNLKSRLREEEYDLQGIDSVYPFTSKHKLDRGVFYIDINKTYDKKTKKLSHVLYTQQNGKYSPTGIFISDDELKRNFVSAGTGKLSNLGGKDIFYRMTSKDDDLINTKSIELPSDLFSKKQALEMLNATDEDDLPETLHWIEGKGLVYNGVCAAGTPDYMREYIRSSGVDIDDEDTVVVKFEGDYIGSCSDGDVVKPSNIIKKWNIKEFMTNLDLSGYTATCRTWGKNKLGHKYCKSYAPTCGNKEEGCRDIPAPLPSEIGKRTQKDYEIEADALAQELANEKNFELDFNKKLMRDVLSYGGIAPHKSGFMSEEYRQIPKKYKRSDGIPMDELAQEMGTDESTLADRIYQAEVSFQELKNMRGAIAQKFKKSDFINEAWDRMKSGRGFMGLGELGKLIPLHTTWETWYYDTNNCKNKTMTVEARKELGIKGGKLVHGCIVTDGNRKFWMPQKKAEKLMEPITKQMTLFGKLPRTIMEKYYHG